MAVAKKKKVVESPDVPESGDRIVDCVKKPTKLLMYVHMRDGYPTQAWVTGTLPKNEMRFSNEMGVVTIKRGIPQGWEVRGGSFTLTLNEELEIEGNVFNPLDCPDPILITNESEYRIFRSCVDCYNEWVSHQSVSGDGAPISWTVPFSTSEGLKSKKDLEVELGDEIPSEDEDSFVGIDIGEEEEKGSPLLLEEIEGAFASMLKESDVRWEKRARGWQSMCQKILTEIQGSIAERQILNGFMESFLKEVGKKR